MRSWRDMTPTEVLDSFQVLTPEMIAYVLGLSHNRGAKLGAPDRQQALKLIDAGKLALIDRDQPRYYWTVSAAEIRRYLEGGPMARRQRNLATDVA